MSELCEKKKSAQGFHQIRSNEATPFNQGIHIL